MDTFAMKASLSESPESTFDKVRALVPELSRAAEAIDKGELYPETLMRRFGEAGAWASHLPQDGDADLATAIACTAAMGERCGATAFLAWCQNALVWYLANTENAAIRDTYLSAVASGQQLGGTGLSNPLKSFFGIEELKLKCRKVDGGYVVRGVLPWVSNLGPDHLFAAICDNQDAPGEPVMVLADCAASDIQLKPCAPFLAMDGTGTYSLQFRDAFIPDAKVIAHNATPFIKKIRAGFILLQVGMALGLIRDCIKLMHEVRPSLGHVNTYLEAQPEDIEDVLIALERETAALAATPYDTSDAYWRRVLALRLRGGEAAVAAAHAAMLHCGARGYVMAHRAQRRLREAYFVAIVTPATKQLRKMLAEMPS